MKKLVLIILLAIISIPTTSKAANIVKNVESKNYSYENVIKQNYFHNFYTYNLTSTAKNNVPEKLLYISPEMACSIAGAAFAINQGFTPGTHEYTLVAWAYYHGCMNH